MKRLFVFAVLFFCYLASAFTATAQDNAWWQKDRQAALAEIQRIEQTTGPVVPQGVILVLDGGADCAQRQLAANCLAEYNKDFTGEGFTVNGHATAVASALVGYIPGQPNSSIAGETGRIKIISVKVIDDATKQITPQRVRDAI